MNYFNKFPQIVYTFEFNGEPRIITVKDIALNIRIQKSLFKNVEQFDEYDIEDGETLESISYRLYGKQHYHWMLMLLNERYDYINDYPMSDVELSRYVSEKYGEENVYSLYEFEGQPYYKDLNGDVVFKLSEERFNLLYPDDSYEIYSSSLEQITNLEYETIINDSKRRIKVLNGAYAEQISADIARLLNVK